MAKLLFVEDDESLAARVKQWLEFEEHMVEHTANGNEALEKLEYFKYELVILDLGLPGMSGIEVLKKFRAKGGNTPVLILTGQNEIEQKTEGLDAGGDDYLTKPFHVKELSARVRALLRRPPEFAGAVLTAGPLVLDTASRRVTVNGSEVVLQPKEFALVEFLIRHANRVVSPDSLLQHVWSSDSEASSETIYTHIKKIRKKLGDNSIIRTVHGVGYTIDAS